MNLVARFFCIILLLVLGSQVQAQTSRSELERKKKSLQKEIDLTNKLIKETKKNKNLSLGQLKILNKKLDDRKRLINAIQQEVGMLNSTITTNGQKIQELQIELDRLKLSYGKLIRQAYLTRNQQSSLVLLFSAKDFQQAYKRLYYLRKYNNYRREQALLIQASQDELNGRVKQLKTDLSTKRDLLGSEEREKKVLSEEKKEQEQTLTALQKKEKSLKKDLDKKRADAKKLDGEIQRIIEREINRERDRAMAKSKSEAEAARKKAEASGKPVPAPVKEPEMRVTSETRALSGKFEANKGRLPWPVDRGVITESFGTHPHPVLKGITTNNNGINIATPQGSNVKAIYDGEVTGVISIPGANMAVILKHGEYLTVYSNLASSSVSKGQKVHTGQAIGVADKDDSGGKSEAHLEIWKGKVKLNPSEWISR
ncbi:MAG TPA: peptidoglycan DD-metalloendopeptidase family protein [Flavobacteriales bacterium]|nr:peptidoglycan DD-metalloendopeptidase family protein [Flavobacteriales bacterium]HPH81212.1 peptidoglycan DD-metalloendopeptidase family protein [Flavobacteriales bacterium]